MKKKLFQAAPIIYLVTIIITECLLLWYLQSIMKPNDFNALFSVLCPTNLFLVIFGTVAVGIWGENKIKKLEGGE